MAPAGPTPARFIGYVEVGNHVEQFEGKDKPAAPQVKLRFELNGPQHKNEFEKDTLAFAAQLGHNVFWCEMLGSWSFPMHN